MIDILFEKYSKTNEKVFFCSKYQHCKHGLERKGWLDFMQNKETNMQNLCQCLCHVAE